MTTRERERTIIPAAPGWYVTYLLPGEDGWADDSLCHDPIIAWEIGRERRYSYIARIVTPITVSGNPDQTTPWAIKKPDGTFDYRGEGSSIFGNETEADLIRNMKRDYEDRAKINKAAAAVGEEEIAEGEAP
jgi:hypothetical protein